MCACSLGCAKRTRKASMNFRVIEAAWAVRSGRTGPGPVPVSSESLVATQPASPSPRSSVAAPPPPRARTRTHARTHARTRGLDTHTHTHTHLALLGFPGRPLLLRPLRPTARRHPSRLDIRARPPSSEAGVPARHLHQPPAGTGPPIDRHRRRVYRPAHRPRPVSLYFRYVSTAPRVPSLQHTDTLH